MPLEISLNPYEGTNDFFVEDTRVTLQEVLGPQKFKLKVHGNSVDKVFTVTGEQAVEIIPQVRVSAGTKRIERDSEVSVIFQAPRRIEILRGKIYRERQGA